MPSFSRFAAAALIVLAGCGRAASRPPSPPDAPASRGASEASQPVLPGAPDPGEEITPDELESIPDPASRSEVPKEPGPTSPARVSPGGRIWRVQIFASPDLSRSDRVARDASARLGESYVVELEGSLYKARLGAFASEREAQNLRERAVREGYTGAFRLRASATSVAP